MSGQVPCGRICGRGVMELPVEAMGERYRCNICGNEVEVIRVGGGTLVCCGEEMELVE